MVVRALLGCVVVKDPLCVPKQNRFVLESNHLSNLRRGVGSRIGILTFLLLSRRFSRFHDESSLSFLSVRKPGERGWLMNRSWGTWALLALQQVDALCVQSEVGHRDEPFYDGLQP